MVKTITMFRGDTAKFKIKLTRAGAVENLAGTQNIWFTAKRKFDDTYAQAIIAKFIGSGITITDTTGGIADLKISPTDTSSLEPSRVTLVYDVQYKDSALDLWTVASGKMFIVPDVSTTS